MSAICQSEETLEIEETGNFVKVPEKPIAKLMYYLSCVNNCTDVNISSKCTKYNNYNSVTFDDMVNILKYANDFSPSFMKRNGIFINEPDLCPDCQNQFYKITSKKKKFAITTEFLYASRQVHTVEFMAYRKSWMDDNYYQPISAYSKEIRAIENNTIEELRPRTHSYNGSKESIPCLMYYLSCVNNLIDLEIPNDLIQYQNYQNLSVEKENQIVCFAMSFDPEFFFEKNLMINDLLICGKYTNKFYNVSELPHKNPILEFNFADKLIHARKIMIFDKEWIQDFYRNPMEGQKKRLEALRKGKIKNFSSKNKVQNRDQNLDSNTAENDKSCLIQ